MNLSVAGRRVPFQPKQLPNFTRMSRRVGLRTMGSIGGKVPITEWITDGDFEEDISGIWDTNAVRLDGVIANHTPGGNWGMYLAATMYQYLEQDILTLKGQACPVNDISLMTLWYRNDGVFGIGDECFDAVITYSDDTATTVTIVMEQNTDYHDVGSTVLAKLTAGKKIKIFSIEKTFPRDEFSMFYIDDIRISTA